MGEAIVETLRSESRSRRQRRRTRTHAAQRGAACLLKLSPWRNPIASRSHSASKAAAC